MRIIALFFLCFLFFSCQKEVSVGTNQIVNSTFDSLVGNWKYIYDYRLTTTQSDTITVIDSLYSGNYEPYSYFRIKADSTYRWYKTAMQSLPALGYGVSGHWKLHETLRAIKWLEEKETQDDFGTRTWDIVPARNGLSYRIKYLSNDSMVLFFRVAGPPGKYYWWHDVFVK